MEFIDKRAANGTKGAVHGALLSIAALCAVYNVGAWRGRREPHLAINGVIYVGLIAFEVYQILRHCERHEV